MRKCLLLLCFLTVFVGCGTKVITEYDLQATATRYIVAYYDDEETCFGVDSNGTVYIENCSSQWEVLASEYTYSSATNERLSLPSFPEITKPELEHEQYFQRFLQKTDTTFMVLQKRPLPIKIYNISQKAYYNLLDLNGEAIRRNSIGSWKGINE